MATDIAMQGSGALEAVNPAAYQGETSPAVPSGFEKALDEILAQIAEDRRQIEADGALIAYLREETGARLERISRKLDAPEATAAGAGR